MSHIFDWIQKTQILLNTCGLLYEASFTETQRSRTCSQSNSMLARSSSPLPRRHTSVGRRFSFLSWKMIDEGPFSALPSPKVSRSNLLSPSTVIKNTNVDGQASKRSQSISSPIVLPFSKVEHV